MVKVSIRVRKGAARFDVDVLADSAQQAVCLVKGRYPTSDVRVKTLTGPEILSVTDRTARAHAMAARAEQRRERRRPARGKAMC